MLGRKALWMTIPKGTSGQQMFNFLQKHCCISLSTTQTTNKEDVQHEEFTPIELYPQDNRGFKRRGNVQRQEVMAPRSASMKPDQDWPDVWPAARTFHPGTVPLPVRMGYPASSQPTPDKWANTELMKIPNFLHLTPPAVQRHCAAIRKFCSPWPAGVSYASTLIAQTKDPDATAKRPKRKKQQQQDPSPEQAKDDPGYFPMMTTRTNYLFSGPSIRDPRARTATVKVRLQDLFLDEHSEDKLLRLVGDRYDRDSNTLTIVADRCPLYVQNLQYCYYLLTVIRAEAQNTEPWEHEKHHSDHREFVYAGSSCEAAVEALQARQRVDGTVPVGGQQRLEAALVTLLNEGETDVTVREYSESVLALLGLQERQHDALSTHNTTLTPEAASSLPPITTKAYNQRRDVIWISHSWTRIKTPF